MKRLMIILAFLVFHNPAVRAQDIVTDISQDEVELRHSFTGQELILFGAIRSADIVVTEETDVVIVITGAKRAQIVRKKEQVMGFWVNSEGQRLEAVPEYYALASTRPLAEIADVEELFRLKIGLEHQVFGHQEGLEEYAKGLIRVKQKAGLYQVATEQMELQSETLFRADFFFPANVPSGTYTATAYLFQGGKLIGRSDKEIKIDKAGFERIIYDLAQNQSWLYGLMAIIIALFAGWLAGFITRPKSRLG